MPVLEPVSSASQASHGNRDHGSSAKERLTGASVFASLLLAGTLIALGERGIYDLNRLFNPHYEVCNQRSFLFSG